MTDDVETTPTEKRKRGGQPRNKNRLTHGDRVADPLLRFMWGTFDPKQQAYLKPIIAAYAAELPGFEDLLDAALPAQPSSPNSPQLDIHSDVRINEPTRTLSTDEGRAVRRERRLQNVITILERWGHLMAADFTRQHAGAIKKIALFIVKIQHLSEVSPDSAASFNKAAYFSAHIHDILFERIGRKMQCPWCGRTQAIMVDPPADDPDEEDDGMDEQLFDISLEQEKK